MSSCITQQVFGYNQKLDQNIAYVGPSLRHPSFEILDEYFGYKTAAEGKYSPRLFAALWHWASTIQRHCVHTHYKYVAGKDLNGKNKAWK